MEKLSAIEAGETFWIDEVPESRTRVRMMRLGFLDREVRVRSNLDRGPVIIKSNGTELAVGSSMADSITVRVNGGDA